MQAPESAAIESPAAAPRRVGWAWLEAALIFLVFAAYAGWPVPEPNEPHYLSKARHYWQPDWIADDFFLSSADSHWTFYLTCGWLSRFMSMPTMAWTGRVLTWALLAIAWRRLSWSLLPTFGAAVVSAALFVATNENFHMAGEWVVGGFEAKGFAYALVFAALAELVRGRWNLTWVLLGAASALHVLVGGWVAVAVAFCWLTIGADRPRLTSMLPGLVAGGLLALPGLVPGLLLNVGADPNAVTRANLIYVYERLPHHLSFFGIKSALRERFALVVLCWVVLSIILPADAGRRRLGRVINASLLIALVGMGLSFAGTYHPDAVAGLLRFYWFRTADALVPLGVALWIVAIASRFLPHIGGRVASSVLLLAASAWLLQPQIAARLSPPIPRADKPGKVANHFDWRDACQWVAAHTPADARFLTPRTAQTFRWYAARSEVATWKDLPQDAQSIVAWRERLDEVYGTGDPEDPWYESLAETPTDRVRSVAKKYGAGYILTESQPPLDFPCLYHNETYSVYELPSAGE
ncbi:MAG TPA: DUF6798 domain-containing protein [Pirellulales bacterium]|jgi:hypothetical protein